MKNFDFAEYAIGGVRNRNRVHRTSEFTLNGIRTDCYRSVFTFDEGLAVWVERTGSVTGYSGAHLAEALVFDFDAADIADAQRDAGNFLRYLALVHELPIEAARIAFSGSKGFHIALPFDLFTEQTFPSLTFWKAYRETALELVGEFPTADPSIYELRRLFRLTGTVNSKSGLHKIPLSFSELTDRTPDEIRTLAASPRTVDFLPRSEIVVLPSLADCWEKWRRHFEEAENGATGTTASAQTLAQSGNSYLRGMFAPAHEGGRNAAAIRLTGLLLSKGFDVEGTLAFLRMWNERNTPPLEDGELSRLVTGAHSRYARKSEPLQVFDLRSAGEAYHFHVRNLQSRRVMFGFPLLDAKTRGLFPGEVAALVAKTSNAKTAFALNTARNFALESGEPVLFFSLEMPVEGIYERAFQLEMNVTGYETEQAFQADDVEVRKRIEFVFSKLPNLYFITKGGLALKDIAAAIRFAEEQVYHRKTGLVLVDYLSLVKGDSADRDEYAKAARVARGMKDLAKECAVPLVFLSQVTKAHGIYDELAIDSGRDSGAIAEAADFVLGLWRTERDEDTTGDALKMTLGILKNRRGGLGASPLHLNRRSLRFSESIPPLK